MNLLGEAIRWHKLGYTPLPIKPNGSKAPSVQSWTHWQDTQPPIGDIITAFTADHDGLGILTGPGSGNFELLEMEGRGVAEGMLPLLTQAFADHDMAELWQRIDGGYSETTPSGGIHWYYRVDDCPVQGNTPLARRPSTEEELAEKPNTRQVLIETRGRGGFTVIAPSTGRTHDTGRSWVVRTGAPETIPTLTADEYEAVHAIAATLDQMPAADPQPAPTTRPRLPGDPKLPGDDLNERATWEEILTPHGWKLVRRSGQYATWARPGKRSPGISATTGKSATGDRLFVFSTSTDFEVQTPYNKFGAYCVVPETKILTADLQWVEAGTLANGDELVGVDEEIPDRCGRRKLRRSFVEGVERKVLPCYEIKLADGRTVVCSDEHPWLASSVGRGGNTRWIQTQKLRPGQRISAITDGTWETLDDFDSGWLSGMFDGEGWVDRTKLSMAQNPGPVMDRAESLLRARGFNPTRLSRGTVDNLAISNMPSVLRALGQLRPMRLLAKRPWEGRGAWTQAAPNAIVQEVNFVGPREVAAFMTSTRTFIAEGLISHNTLLNHGGDFQAAASALRGQGYGDAEEDPMDGLYAGPGQERNQFTVADVLPQPADSGDAEEAEGGAAPTWQPVDLATFLDGTYRPAEPALLPRSDGVHLLYPGLTHSFHGESESGKSLVAQAEAVRVLNQGGTVLFCDFESDPASVVGRLLMLGAHPNAIRERFKYVQPETNLTSSIEAAAWNATLGQLFDLAVIDGVTASLGLFGGETKDNDNVTRWARLLPDRIARKTGAAVVSVDHVTKNADTRGRFAIGGQAKMAALTGAAYVVEVVQPLGRDLRGVIVLRVGKDRPGYIRARSGAWRAQDRTQEAARVVVDSTGPRTLVTVEAPQGVTPGSDDFRPTGLMERISRMLEQATDPQSFNQIDQDIEGKREYKRTALATLGQEGYISIATGQRQAQLHASVKPYRQTADPKSDHYAGGNQSAAKNGSEGGLDRFPLKGGEPGTSRLPVPGTSREPVGNREPGRHARETGLEGLISPVTPGNWPESGPETPENQSESVPGQSGNQSGTSGNQSELLGAETQSGRGGNQSGTSQASPGTSREPVGTSRLGAGTPEAAPIRAEAADAGCPDCGGPLDPQRAAAGYNCLACYRRATA